MEKKGKIEKNAELQNLDVEDSNVMYMKCKAKTVRNRDYVYQGNPLINASYSLSLMAKKTLLYAIAQIDESDEPYLYYMINVVDYKELIGASRSKKNYFNLLKEAVDELDRIKITVYDRSGAEYYVPLIGAAKKSADNKQIGFNFHKEIMPFLFDLKNHGRKFGYTKYHIENVIRMQSFYSIRFYEIIIMRVNLNKKSFTIPLSDLRTKLHIPDDRFKKYNHFKTRVLEPVTKEINNLTDIKVRYSENKKSRAVCAITFTITKPKETFLKETLRIEQKRVPSREHIPDRLIALIPEADRTPELLELVLAYKKSKGEDYLHKNLIYTARYATSKFPQYLSKALRYNYGKDIDIENSNCSLTQNRNLNIKISDLRNGMVVLYKGEHHTIAAGGIILDGKALPPVSIVRLINDGTMEIVAG